MNNEFDQIKETVKKFVREPIYPYQAYELGKDCANNGPNDKNCHFSIFSSPENTREWERGKREAALSKLR